MQKGRRGERGVQEEQKDKEEHEDKEGEEEESYLSSIDRRSAGRSVFVGGLAPLSSDAWLYRCPIAQSPELVTVLIALL